MKTICICCPVGCPLDIKQVGSEIVVSGNTCPRGEAYGKKEIVAPERVVTSVVPFSYGTVSVKTTKSIPKQHIFCCLSELKSLLIKNPKIGDVLIHNVCGTDSDIVVTGVHND